MPVSGVDTISSELHSRFLEGLAPPVRKGIIGAATQRRFNANFLITNQGHPAEHLYLLTKGRARHFIVTAEGKKVLLQWLVPGDIIGGRTLLASRLPYLSSSEALKDCSVLVWHRTVIRGLVARYPKLMQNALSVASDYVTWHLTSQVVLASHTARQRVAQVLVTLARTIGQKIPSGITIQITNEELANAANVTHFTASRLISGWHRDHTLVKRRGNVLLVSTGQLSREAELRPRS